MREFHKIPPELKGIKSLSHAEVAKIISKYSRMSKLELEETIDDSSAPVLEIAIASIFKIGIQRSDHLRISFLLDRAIGKVREIPDTEENEGATDELKKLSMNELLTLVKNNLPAESE